MEWVNIAVTALAFLIIGLHQRKRIKNLENQLNDQKGILDNAQKYMNVINIDQLKQYAEVREEKAKKEAEIEKLELNQINNHLKNK